METALYFPYSTIEDPFLLKSALLLWDQLEYISPGDWLEPHTSDRDILEAIEIVGKPIYPTARIKEKIHRRVLDFFREGVPKKYVPVPQDVHFPIYADKFARETWMYLTELRLIDGRFAPNAVQTDHPDYRVVEGLAVLLMAMLADECAGRTARKVTDADFAHLSHAAVVLRENNGDFLTTHAEHQTCIVSLLTPVLPIADVELSKLITVRKKESAFINSLRENYRIAVDEYIDEIVREDNNDFDFLRIVDGFRKRMLKNLTELDRMLGRRNKMDLISFAKTIAKGVATGVTTLVVSHDIAAALTAAKTAVGAEGICKLLGSIPGGRDKREKILRENPAAWLYEIREATGGRLPMSA